LPWADFTWAFDAAWPLYVTVPVMTQRPPCWAWAAGAIVLKAIVSTSNNIVISSTLLVIRMFHLSTVSLPRFVARA
jgi:hypothetical protein